MCWKTLFILVRFFFCLFLVVLLVILEVWRYISEPSVEHLWNENLLICYKPIALCCAVLSQSLQSCPTLSDPMEYSLPGSSIHGILQARILECVAMPSSKGSQELYMTGQLSLLLGECRVSYLHFGPHNTILALFIQSTPVLHIFKYLLHLYTFFDFGWGFPGSSDSKVSAYNVGEPGSIPGLGRSPGEGNGNPFQYSCLGNPMDREACWATIHGVAKNRTQLSD